MIKPLLAIMSPRTIPEVISAYNKIDYVDKCWFKWYTEKEALAQVQTFFAEHKEYTHLILTGDDTVPTYDCVAYLLADIEAHPEIEVISVVVGMDKFAGDDRLSATIEPVTDTEPNKELTYSDYKRLPYEFINTKGILRVWYQGFAFTLMSRRIVETIGLKTWCNGEWMSDLKFSFDLAQNNISQYVDLRLFMWHYRHECPKNNDYEVRNRPDKRTFFQQAKVPVPKCDSAKILSYDDIPVEMDLYKIIHGKYDKFVKICIVTEFEQGEYQWYKAFDKFSETHNFVHFTKVEMNPINLELKSNDYWNPIKEADVVFCYIACRNIRGTDEKIWRWWEELPKRCRQLMKTDAKLIVQYDDELQFMIDVNRRSWNLGWEKDKEYFNLINSLKPETFYSEVFSIADAYFTVLKNPPWAKYCKKPIYYMPLPQLFRYPVLNTYWDFWSYKLKLPLFKNRTNRIVIIHHTFIKSAYEHSLKYLKMPVLLFTSRDTSPQTRMELLKILPQQSSVVGRIPQEQYIQILSQERVALDDNLDYDGWSRFAMECAIMFVPCVGSTVAVQEFFPELYTSPQDYATQIDLLTKLLTDETFCKIMALRGQKRVLYKLSYEKLCVDFLKYTILNMKCPTSKLTDEDIKLVTEHHFVKFLVKILPYYTIPSRPYGDGSVFDPITNKNLTQKQWDEYYGRWSIFLQDKEKYVECRRKALLIKNNMQ